MCLALKLYAKRYQFWQNCENPVSDVWISECSWNNLDVNKLRHKLVIIVPDEKFESWRKSPNLMKGLGRQQNVMMMLKKALYIISQWVSMKCCTRCGCRKNSSEAWELKRTSQRSARRCWGRLREYDAEQRSQGRSKIWKVSFQVWELYEFLTKFFVLSYNF